MRRNKITLYIRRVSVQLVLLKAKNNMQVRIFKKLLLFLIFINTIQVTAQSSHFFSNVINKNTRHFRQNKKYINIF